MSEKVTTSTDSSSLNHNVPASSKKSVMVVIGCGNAGMKQLETLVTSFKKEDHDIKLIGIDMDGQRIEDFKARVLKMDGNSAWGATSGEAMFITLGDSKGAGGDPDKAEEALREKEDEIKTFVKGADSIQILAGLGGGSGTGISLALAKILAPTLPNENEERVHPVVTPVMPFAAEGLERIARAKKAVKELAHHLCVIPFYNESLYFEDEEAQLLPIDQAYERINKRVIIPAVTNVSYLIRKVFSGQNADARDWDFTAQGKWGYLNHFVFPLEGEDTANSHSPTTETVKEKIARLREGAVEVAHKLLRNVYQDYSRIIPASTRAFFVCCGLTTVEYNAFTETINKEMDPESNKSISLRPGIDGGKVREVFIFMTAPELIEPELVSEKATRASVVPEHFRGKNSSDPSAPAVGTKKRGPVALPPLPTPTVGKEEVPLIAATAAHDIKTEPRAEEVVEEVSGPDPFDEMTLDSFIPEAREEKTTTIWPIFEGGERKTVDVYSKFLKYYQNFEANHEKWPAPKQQRHFSVIQEVLYAKTKGAVYQAPPAMQKSLPLSLAETRKEEIKKRLQGQIPQKARERNGLFARR